MNTGHTVLGVVTGKPISLGGSLGRASSTSRGVVHVALEALTHLGIAYDGATAAVQGFGKVGRGTARFLAEAGVRVEAVADQYGAIRAPGGIDLAALETYVDETGTVVGFDGASPIDAGDLLELAVDLLVPAAVEGVLHAGNAERVRARLVVEGANGPTTSQADDILAARASPSCRHPGNAGGVIVWYFEWVQANQAYWWTEDEVEARLADRMIGAWHYVLDHAKTHQLTLRAAATSLAVQRVAEAHRQRGLYP